MKYPISIPENNLSSSVLLTLLKPTFPFTFICFFAFLSCLFFSSCKKEDDLAGRTDLDKERIQFLNEVLEPIASNSPLDWADTELHFLDVAADKKIVGLGEATHGTKEFFQAKHRLFRYLVENHGYKIFAFEADFGESIYLNNLIQEGNTAQLKSEMQSKMIFWTWATEEVLELLIWMAEYNVGKSAEEKLHYVGVDCQFNRYNLDWVGLYLQKHDATLYEKAAPLLPQISTATTNSYDQTMTTDSATYLLNVGYIEGLISLMEEKKGDLVQKSSLKEFEFHLYLLTVAQQSLKVAYSYTTEGFRKNYRDGFMADNAIWYQAHLGDKKMAYWAHNYHVSKTSTGPSTGNHLFKQLDADYHVVGFTFNKGSFTAFNNGLRSNTITADPVYPSVNYHFGSTDEPVFMIDLNNLREDENWRRYFISADCTYFEIGSVYNNKPEDYYNKFFSDHYDQLIHIESTGAAMQLR